MTTYLASAILLFISLVHTLLGERVVLRPLFSEAWNVPMSRRPAERIIRMVWHATSVAWGVLALSLVGMSPGAAVGIACLSSGVVLLVFLRGHLAWPLFLAAGLLALHGSEALPDVVLDVLVLAALVLSLAVASLHLYWALGGRWALGDALPTHADGRPLFQPGPLACAAVAMALVVLCLAVGARHFEVGPSWLRWVVVAALALLVLRAIGDRRQVGFSKSNRRTRFAKRDDTLYTPLVVVLAFGAMASLL